MLMNGNFNTNVDISSVTSSDSSPFLSSDSNYISTLESSGGANGQTGSDGSVQTNINSQMNNNVSKFLGTNNELNQVLQRALSNGGDDVEISITTKSLENSEGNQSASKIPLLGSKRLRDISSLGGSGGSQISSFRTSQISREISQ